MLCTHCFYFIHDIIFCYFGLRLCTICFAIFTTIPDTDKLAPNTIFLWISRKTVSKIACVNESVYVFLCDISYFSLLILQFSSVFPYNFHALMNILCLSIHIDKLTAQSFWTVSVSGVELLCPKLDICALHEVYCLRFLHHSSVVLDLICRKGVKFTFWVLHSARTMNKTLHN